MTDSRAAGSLTRVVFAAADRLKMTVFSSLAEFFEKFLVTRHPKGYDEFVIFWKKSIETFPQTRHYSSFEFSQKRRCSGPGEENLGLFVEICSDNELIKTTPSADWDACRSRCVVSFNRNPPEVCLLTEINRKIHDISQFVQLTEEKTTFSPFSDVDFERLDQIFAFFHLQRTDLVEKVLKVHGVSSELTESHLKKLEELKLYAPAESNHVKHLFEAFHLRVLKLPEFLIPGLYHEFHKLNVIQFHEKWIKQLAAADFLVPNKVINGYWVYTDPQSLKIHPNSPQVIRIPPYAVSCLSKIEPGGTLEFGVDFLVDPAIFYPLRQLGGQMTRVSGFVALKNVVKGCFYHYPDVPGQIFCNHHITVSKQWFCAACCGPITKNKDFRGDGYVRCRNCGISRDSDAEFYCFCPDKSSFNLTRQGGAGVVTESGGESARNKDEKLARKDALRRRVEQGSETAGETPAAAPEVIFSTTNVCRDNLEVDTKLSDGAQNSVGENAGKMDGQGAREDAFRRSVEKGPETAVETPATTPEAIFSKSSIQKDNLDVTPTLPEKTRTPTGSDLEDEFVVLPLVKGQPPAAEIRPHSGSSVEIIPHPEDAGGNDQNQSPSPVSSGSDNDFDQLTDAIDVVF